MNSPVEEYLDALHQALVATIPTRQLRHLLIEAEAHLYDHVDLVVSQGLSRDQAELRAVEHFGPVETLAAGEVAAVRTPWSVLFSQFLRVAWLLGGVGAVAGGVSGAIAWLMHFAGGDRFLNTVTSGKVLSPSDCTRWLALSPPAKSCAAVVEDWANETVFYRLAVGVLGIVALAAWLALRRRAALAGIGLVRDVLGTASFVVATAVTGARALSAVVTHQGDGTGQWLSAAPTPLAAALVFGRRLVSEADRESGPELCQLDF